MTAQQYWIGKVAVVEWALADLTGNPVDDAVVTGTVTLPDGTTADMTVNDPATDSGDPYRVTYDPTGAGLHAYRVAASGSVTDAEEGTFIVLPSLVGAPTITTDVTTAVGKIRLLISDTDISNPVFTDAEIGAFYALEANNVRMGAAQALDTLASNEAMVSKVIRTLDLQVDGTKVAAELRARATTLRETAADFDNDGNLFGMDIVDFRPDRFWWGPEQTESVWCG